MPESCSECGQPYNPEPGFYFGAPYVSWAINVALGATAFVGTYVIFDLTKNISLFTVAAVIVLLAPVTYPLSRSAWIHMFVRYRPKAKMEES